MPLNNQKNNLLFFRLSLLTTRAGEDDDTADDATAFCTTVSSFKVKPKLYSLPFTETQVLSIILEISFELFPIPLH